MLEHFHEYVGQVCRVRPSPANPKCNKHSNIASSNPCFSGKLTCCTNSRFSLHPVHNLFGAYRESNSVLLASTVSLTVAINDIVNDN